MQPQMSPIDSSDNLFHDGNPLTGVKGTIVTAEWLNAVQASTRDIQAELIAILTASALAPDDTAGQLLAAIRKLTMSRTNPGADLVTDGSVSTFLQNLGLGDIALAGVCTGVLDDAGHIDIPMVINGEKKKLIIQWGSTSTTTSGATVTLPTTFPTKYCAGVGCEAGAYASIKVVAIIPLSLSTIGVYGRAAGTSTLANTNVKWIVIGY